MEDKKEEKVDPRVEELKETIDKVLGVIKSADISVKGDDKQVKQVVADILDAMNEDKVTLNESDFVVQNVLAILDTIFRAFAQTVGEAKNDKIANMFGEDIIGKVLVSDLTKS